jgi:hypothetical protein
MTTITTATAGVSYAYTGYMQLLAEVADTGSRAGRAALLDQMAGFADLLADATYGQLAEDDPSGDSVAWRETATLIRHLAAAERGTTLAVIPPLDDDPDSDDGDGDGDGEDGDDFADLSLWAGLSFAKTRYEQTAAVHALSELLLARKTRPHAYEAFMAAATACSLGYGDDYPAQDTYQPRS